MDLVGAAISLAALLGFIAVIGSVMQWVDDGWRRRMRRERQKD